MKVKIEEDMFFGASPEIFRRAEMLRRQMTEAEKILWEELRNNKLNGLKFRRQHPVSNFIADFYCHQKKLIIELDGSIHFEKEQREYDEGRTDELASLGIRVIRFSNQRIINDLQKVIAHIEKITSEIE